MDRGVEETGSEARGRSWLRVRGGSDPRNRPFVIGLEHTRIAPDGRRPLTDKIAIDRVRICVLISCYFEQRVGNIVGRSHPDVEGEARSKSERRNTGEELWRRFGQPLCAAVFMLAVGDNGVCEVRCTSERESGVTAAIWSRRDVCRAARGAGNETGLADGSESARRSTTTRYMGDL